MNIPADGTKWPAEWRTTYYKSYPRYKKISLGSPALTADFSELIRGRRTDRNFAKDALTFEKISALLKYSCGITGEADFTRRAYPSGGARYPLEIYPIIFCGCEGVPAGVYHYNAKDHTLDILAQRPFQNSDIMRLSAYPWVQNSSMLLVITAVFWRNQNKYGERGYRYILLEAGHVGQNLYLASGALGLKCSGLGGTRDANIESLLRVDGIGESLVYSLVIG